MFYFVDPLGSHNRLPLRTWNYIPDIILHNGLILFLPIQDVVFLGYVALGLLLVALAFFFLSR